MAQTMPLTFETELPLVASRKIPRWLFGSLCLFVGTVRAVQAQALLPSRHRMSNLVGGLSVQKVYFGIGFNKRCGQAQGTPHISGSRTASMTWINDCSTSFYKSDGICRTVEVDLAETPLEGLGMQVLVQDCARVTSVYPCFIRSMYPKFSTAFEMQHVR